MNRLPKEAHRVLYNVRDALAPPEPGGAVVDSAPVVEALIARRGEAAARRLIRILARLEKTWWVGWRAQAFSRLDRLERAARLAQHARERASDHAWLLSLLAEVEEAAARQSASDA